MTNSPTTTGRPGPRSSRTLVLTSPVRFALSAAALTAGFAYVLEAEDQFKRAAWFGLAFAALTGAWFVVGSFLAAVDTVGVYRYAIGVGLASAVLWIVGRGVSSPEWIDDVGELQEPLTRLRLGLAGVVTVAAAGVLLTARRIAAATEGPRHRAARLAGVVSLAVGLLAVLLTARSQAYFDPDGSELRSLATLLTHQPR
jgi:hypothetical protein